MFGHQFRYCATVPPDMPEKQYDIFWLWRWGFAQELGVPMLVCAPGEFLCVEVDVGLPL